MLPVLLGASLITGPCHAAGTGSNRPAVPVFDEDSCVSRLEEAELRTWKPPANGYVAPPPAMIVHTLDVAGDWEVKHAMEGASLHIEPGKNGAFNVRFATGGCLQRWHLLRTGEFKDGVLTFDRPVGEYLPIKYRRLYAMRFDQSVYLVPECSVRELLKLPHELGPEFFGFRRSPAGRNGSQRKQS